MDWLDLIILVLVLLCGWLGFRRGLSWVAPTLISLIMGIVVGALLAPTLARHLTGNLGIQSTIAITLLFACILLIEGVGTAIGFRIRVRAMRSRYVTWDSALGAVLSGLGVLAAAWFLGLAFSQSTWPLLVSEIQNSAIVHGLDDVAPQPPSLVGDIEHVISASQWPNPLIAITGPDVPDLPIPTGTLSTDDLRSAQSVVKVLSFSPACQSEEAGSGWPVAHGYIITNAHVVAGGDRVTIDAPSGQVVSARVVLFDPETDVAVLYSPQLAIAPLATVAADPASGTTGAVVGYPNGGGQQQVAAAVRGTESARGEDIYDANTVVRDIEVLAARIIPGNSGGPMLNRNGQVIGMVFAASTTSTTTGYALTVSQIQNDISSAVGQTTAVATTWQGNVCAQ